MKIQFSLFLTALFSVSSAFAVSAGTSAQQQVVHVTGVLISISGPGGETTGLALFDKLNGKQVAEVDDQVRSAKNFLVDPCSKTYQAVEVTGHYESRYLGPIRKDADILVAEKITSFGAPLAQDITPNIAIGLCPVAVNHKAFADLEKAYQGDLSGTYNNQPCGVTVSKTTGSVTVQVQSTEGTQSCTLSDNDPNLSETKTKYGELTFDNGAVGTFASPNACNIMLIPARGHTIIGVTAPGDNMSSCTVN